MKGLRKEFTMLEIITVGSILMVILGTILLVMRSGFEQSTSSQERLEGVGNASFFLRNLRDDFQKAIKARAQKNKIELITSYGGQEFAVEYTGEQTAKYGRIRRTQKPRPGSSGKSMNHLVARNNIFDVEFTEFKGTSVQPRFKIFGFKFGSKTAQSQKTRFAVAFKLKMQIKGKKIVEKDRTSIFQPPKMAGNKSGDATLWKPNKSVDEIQGDLTKIKTAPSGGSGAATGGGGFWSNLGKKVSSWF
ncbi:hypothetical protein ACFL35_08965 [Candidatus Riflebacteria bacterium]